MFWLAWVDGGWCVCGVWGCGGGKLLCFSWLGVMVIKSVLFIVFLWV